jgi:hypothetical protein
LVKFYGRRLRRYPATVKSRPGMIWQENEQKTRLADTA